MLGDFLLFVGRAHLGVGPHHIGHQGDSCSIGCRLSRVGIGLRRLDTALQGAEQVELVGGGDANIAHIGHRHLVRQQECFAGLLQTLGADFHTAAPAACRLRFVDLCPGPGNVRRCHSQIGVGDHGLLHQLIQARILVQPPPITGHGRGNDVLVVHRQLALEIITVHGGFVRQVVIRPDHLAGRQQHAQADHRQTRSLAHCAGSCC